MYWLNVDHLCVCLCVLGLLTAEKRVLKKTFPHQDGEWMNTTVKAALTLVLKVTMFKCSQCKFGIKSEIGRDTRKRRNKVTMFLTDL